MKTIQQAAQALCDHWDTPKWKVSGATAGFVHELRTALASEEAQTVEPAGIIVEAGGMMLELDFYRDLPAGTLLYTHPAPTTEPSKPPKNCGTGHCSCIECLKPVKPSAGEREALIARHKELDLGGDSELAYDALAVWSVDAADMLAADALKITELSERVKELEDKCWKTLKELTVEAQQVAVPQGLHSLVEKWDKDSSRSTPADAMLINKCIRELSAFITAPQPPQVAELTDLQEREAFNEWRKAFINETGHHPEAVDAWKFRAGLAAQKGKS